jgi:DNA-binding transcriptional ArsR family regulator
VGEIEEILEIGQPTLSQQLTVLRDEELVSTRREGKNIFYQINSPQAMAVIQVMYEQFCKPGKKKK